MKYDIKLPLKLGDSFRLRLRWRNKTTGQLIDTTGMSCDIQLRATSSAAPALSLSTADGSISMDGGEIIASAPPALTAQISPRRPLYADVQITDTGGVVKTIATILYEPIEDNTHDS